MNPNLTDGEVCIHDHGQRLVFITKKATPIGAAPFSIFSEILFAEFEVVYFVLHHRIVGALFVTGFLGSVLEAFFSGTHPFVHRGSELSFHCQVVGLGEISKTRVL